MTLGLHVVCLCSEISYCICYYFLKFKFMKFLLKEEITVIAAKFKQLMQEQVVAEVEKMMEKSEDEIFTELGRRVCENGPFEKIDLSPFKREGAEPEEIHEEIMTCIAKGKNLDVGDDFEKFLLERGVEEELLLFAEKRYGFTGVL